MGSREQLIAERFKITMELFELAEGMVRQKLKRKNPLATEAEIEAGIREWLEHRPGAKYGDGVGRPIVWPRRS